MHKLKRIVYHVKGAALLLALPLSLILLLAGQQRVLMQGQDTSGSIRTVVVDSSGRIIQSANASAIATTSSAETTTLAANGTACTTPGGAACTVVYPGNGDVSDFSSWTSVTLQVTNTGSNALTNGLVEVKGCNSNTWVTIDSTSLAALASAASVVISFSGNSYCGIRIEGRSASGTTVLVDANVNAG